MRMTASTLPLFESQHVDIDPYYNFIASFQGQITKLLFSETAPTKAALIKQMKIDFACVVNQTFMYLTDEEKAYFTKAPYQFAEDLATLLMENDNKMTH